MNPADEISILMEQLTDAWGRVVIECSDGECIVANRQFSNINKSHIYEAPTLLEALRLAVEAEQVQE